MLTLYRKYRPQNFQEVVNQNHVKITLQHEISNDSMSHAYLFCGPRAVGKTTIARVLAKAVNCLERPAGQFEPCNRCVSCQTINAGRSLDIIEIDAASHTGVDNVRENIISASRMAPAQGKFKVFIIDEVHMLSISAFNALLKTLEEPPLNVIFILCTTEVHKIPATIISRTERFDFKRIGVADLTKKLKYIAKAEGVEIETGILESIARYSDGHMRDAESLLGQVVSIGGKKITQQEADLVIPRNDLDEAVNLLGAISRKDAAAGIGLVNRLIDNGIDLKTFIKDTIEIARRIMLAKISSALAEKLGLDLGESLELKVASINEELSLESLMQAINKFSRAKNELKDSFIPQLPLEIAITELCLAGTAPEASSPAGPDSRPKTPPSKPGQKPGPSPIQPATEPSPASTSKLDLNTIASKWNEVLARIKTHNHSLSFILRVCRPKSLGQNRLCLAFKYKFHKDRISEQGISQTIENILQEVYGAKLKVEAVIDETLAVANMPEMVMDKEATAPVLDKEPAAEGGKIEEPSIGSGEEKIINNLLKTFGGKVV